MKNFIKWFFEDWRLPVFCAALITATILFAYLLTLNNNSKDYHYAPLRVYQIEIESQDTFAVYDGHRLVGKCFLTDDSEIGYLIIHDNQ